MSRILIHSLVFPPDGVSTADLLGELVLALRARGHSLSVITTVPHYATDPVARARQPLRTVIPGVLYRSDYHGVHVWHVNVRAKRRLLGRIVDHLVFHIVSLALGLTRAGRCDVVLAVSPPLSIGAVAWAMNVFRRCPVIYNVQELYPDFAIRQGFIRNRLVIRALRMLERFVYRRSAALVPISDGFAAALLKRGARPERVHVIPNFVDTSLVHPVSANGMRAQMGGGADTILYYGGNIGVAQDWDIVLALAERVRDDSVLIAISGEGVRLPYLRAEIARRKLRNINLMGYYERARILEVYSACDIALIPMVPEAAHDTLPSKVLTIMACAKPVVVSAEPDSEIAALVKAADSGIVVAPGAAEAFAHAVRALAADHARRVQMGLNGRAYVTDHYPIGAAADRYDRLVRSLC